MYWGILRGCQLESNHSILLTVKFINKYLDASRHMVTWELNCNRSATNVYYGNAESEKWCLPQHLVSTAIGGNTTPVITW